MLGDLLVVRQRSQLLQVELDRALDQAVDLEPVVGESAVEQGLVLL